MQSKDRHENIDMYFKYTIQFLSFMGINTSTSGCRNVKTNHLIKVPSLIALALQMFLTVSETFALREAITDEQYVQSYQIIIEMVTAVIIISKGCRLMSASEQIGSVLRDLTLLWQRHLPGHRIRHQVIEEAKITLAVCKTFVLATLVAVPIWSAPLVSNWFSFFMNKNSANYTFDYSKKIFFMKYPFEIHSPLRYFLICLEEEFVVAGCALFYVSANMLFAQATTHISLQFKILRYDFESLFDEKRSDFSLKKNFAVLVDRHNILLGLCNRLEKIFRIVILIMVVASSINICFNTFTVLQLIDDENYDAILNYAVVFVITLLELSFYCVFAERLTESTSMVGDGILQSKWADEHHKLGMYLQMATLRSQRPCYCTAFKFFPIGHMRLTTVLKASVSYFMMLRAIA